jgi:5-methylcytosine-specific restriction protein A
MDNELPQVGGEISNDELVEIFKCGPQGGMRRSLSTNTLVLTSKHIDNVYDDRWIGSIFHYTGMGLEGDQRLSYAQNKTLAESGTNGVEVHLFEVFTKGRYSYMGRVELAGDPYEEQQTDQNSNPRRVWVFPLKSIESRLPALPLNRIAEAEEKKAKEAKKLSESELRARAAKNRSQGASRQVNSTYYERDLWISEYAKRRAVGVCQLCDQRAPFNNKAGDPYLETHHIQWLSQGGEDSIENTVALCPNCHRKMHTLNLPADIQKLRDNNRD